MDLLGIRHGPEELGDLGAPVLFRLFCKSQVTAVGLGCSGKGFSQLFLQLLRQEFIQDKLEFMGSASWTGIRRPISFMNIAANGTFPILVHAFLLTSGQALSKS